MTATDALQQFLPCTTAVDLISSPEQTPDAGRRNPTHMSMPSLAGQSEQLVHGRPPSGKSRDSFQRSSSSQSLPSGDDSQKKRYNKMAGKGNQGTGNQFYGQAEFHGDTKQEDDHGDERMETRQGSDRVSADELHGNY